MNESTMKNGEQRVLDLEETWRRGYSEHAIEEETQERVRLRKPGSGALWTELVLGEQGTLLVHGDGPNIVFRAYRRGYTLRRLVHWVGKSSTNYIASKVVAGAGHSWDAELAALEIQEYIDEDTEFEGDGEHPLASIIEHLDERFSGEVELFDAITDINSEYFELSFGEMPSRDLISARAACCRAVELWDAADAQAYIEAENVRMAKKAPSRRRLHRRYVKIENEDGAVEAERYWDRVRRRLAERLAYQDRERQRGGAR